MANGIGQQLGNYRLIRLLGRGGFAEVYLGEHIYMQTQAAIKVLHTRLTPEDIEQFRLEAQTIANLEHPHIIRVLEFGVERATPFLVMSYAPNGTLRQHHPRGTHLPLATVVTYVKQVADALQYAHDEKLIHRDVKPENMLVGRRNEVLLGDFGIALVAQATRSQATQEVIGTVAYMAPEQIRGKPRPASDQYSLGIIAYEWLSGNVPFQGSALEVYGQHMHVPPEPLRERVPTLSAGVEQVVMQALAKEPHERFKNIQAFASALEQASNSPTFVLPTQKAIRPDFVTTSTEVVSPVAESKGTRSSRNTVQTTEMAPSSKSTSSPKDTLALNLKPSLTQHLISRRTVLIGLAGLTLVGGGLVLWMQTPHTLYTYRGHSDQVSTVAWSPDGKRIASGSGDGTVQAWDAADGNNVHTYLGYSLGSPLAWSPDGTQVATSTFVSGVGQQVQVLEVSTGKQILSYPDASFGKWSPDGKHFAVAANDGVQVWDTANGSKLYTYTAQATTFSSNGQVGASRLAWSPDGTRIAVGTVQLVDVWNAADGSHIYTYHGHENKNSDQERLVGLAWSPDSKRIVSATSSSNDVHVWDATDGSHVYIYKGHTYVVFAVDWSPTSNQIASASGDNTVQVWNAADGSNASFYHGHDKWVNTLAWSPDGKRIATGGQDKTVQVWSVGGELF